jgi:hypothetical protein
MNNSRGIHDLFWPAEPLSPTARAGQAGSYAFAESDSFLLRDRGENGNDRILEDTAGIEVRLGETAITDAGPSQSVEMSEGFKDAFAGEAIERPKQEQVKTAMGGISEHFLELNAVTVSARLAVGVFAADRPTLPYGELAELRELVFDFLAFVSGAHTSIDRDSRVRYRFSHRIPQSRLLWLGARSR